MEFKMHGRRIGKKKLLEINNGITAALHSSSIMFPRYDFLVLIYRRIVFVYCQGSLCNDFCVTEWCTYCVMCQLHRELNYVGGRR